MDMKTEEIWFNIKPTRSKRAVVWDVKTIIAGAIQILLNTKLLCVAKSIESNLHLYAVSLNTHCVDRFNVKVILASFSDQTFLYFAQNTKKKSFS